MGQPLVCLCGLVLEGTPPQTCSRCGVTVTHPVTPVRPVQDMDALMRDEMRATTTSAGDGW